jgi:long-subunit acyl-CoA synthetase (AMP-forming)
MKLTVKEYAKNHNISVQSVYKRLKQNKLNSIIENRIKYIISENEDFKPLKGLKLLTHEFALKGLKLENEFSLLEQEKNHEINLLKKELELKNELLNEKDKLIQKSEQTIEAEQRTNMALTHNLRNMEKLQLENEAIKKRKRKKFLGIF